MPDFFPIRTADGSISLYNTVVNDVYHSDVGSYTEAVEKYVKPSGILDFVQNNNTVSILDVCFGLGYNSLASISEILKINPSCTINVTALELDMEVLAFIPFIDYLYANTTVSNFYKTAILKGLNIDKSDVTFTKDSLPSYSEIDFNNACFSGHLKFTTGVSECTDNKSASLHNIYYQSISDRNITDYFSFNYSENNLNLEVHVSDARKAVKSLNRSFDFIFLDPFTPSKLPTLWSYEFFKELHRLLNNEGNLTTYSSNSAARGAMLQAGFHIGRTEPVGKKMSGTIAYKNINSYITPLTDREAGLVKTKAGIPYYDVNLNGTPDEINFTRSQLQLTSDRMPSGRYLKSYRKQKFDYIGKSQKM